MGIMVSSLSWVMQIYITTLSIAGHCNIGASSILTLFSSLRFLITLCIL